MCTLITVVIKLFSIVFMLALSLTFDSCLSLSHAVSLSLFFQPVLQNLIASAVTLNKIPAHVPLLILAQSV